MLRVTSYFRRLPLHGKLLLITLVASSVALVFAAATYPGYPLSMLRHELMGDEATLANVVAEKGRVAILRNNREALRPTLDVLSGHTYIAYAFVNCKTHNGSSRKSRRNS